MEIIEYVKNKFDGLENKKKLLCLINSNIIMVILSLLNASQLTGSREFLLNGVKESEISKLKSASDVNDTNMVATFLKGLIILTIIWISLYIILRVVQHFIVSIRYEYVLILINTTIFGLVNVYKQQGDIIFNLVISAIVIYVYYYIIYKKKIFYLEKLEISERKSKIILGTVFSCYLIIVGGLTVIRYLNYQQRIFDTSIFCQMFYYMSKWGLPYTTVERHRLVSHFAVHFAPIYYVILPGYLLFNSPIYLAIAKTLLMASGAIALYKLSKVKGLSNLISLMISVSYLLFPFLIASNIGTGNGHILNENYFYPALVIWIFYYIEKQNFKGMWIFCILTLLVKEDAPIILACIGLHLILTKKSNFHGKILFVVSAVYFLVCTKLIIPHFGDEHLILDYYNNFVPDGSLAFPCILYAILYKPSYVVQQIFTPGKITFLLELFAPLMFLPLITLKKAGNLVLIIPIVLTSLLCVNPCYIYKLASHHNMIPICISFYLTIIALSEIKSMKRQFFLVLSILVVTSIFTVSYNSDKIDYLTYYMNNRSNIHKIDTALNKIPEDASVTADGAYSTKLTNRLKLYSYFEPSCEYVVLDLRKGQISGNHEKSITDLLKGNEYGVTDYKKDLYLILQKHHSIEKNIEVCDEQFKK